MRRVSPHPLRQCCSQGKQHAHSKALEFQTSSNAPRKPVFHRHSPVVHRIRLEYGESWRSPTQVPWRDLGKLIALAATSEFECHIADYHPCRGNGVRVVTGFPSL